MPPRKTIPIGKPRKSAPPAVRQPGGGMSERQKGLFLVAFEQSLSVVDAAAQADVTLLDARNARRDDPEFDLACRSILVAEGEKIQKAGIAAAKKGDPAWARLVLPVLLPEVYGNRVTIDINVNRPEDLEKVDDEKIDEVITTCLKLQNS